MKTVTFFKRGLFLLLGISVMTLMACEKDDKKPADDDKNSDWIFEMEVDGKKWKAEAGNYFSFLHEQEEGSDIEDVYALNMNVVNANQEKFSLLFSIPASEIRDATGSYDFGQTEIRPNVFYVSGSVSFEKGDKRYTPDYDKEAIAGKFILTKAVFGPQGVVDGLALGDGLNEIEGSLEFELFDRSVDGDNKIKLKKGKFKLKSGIMQ